MISFAQRSKRRLWTFLDILSHGPMTTEAAVRHFCEIYGCEELAFLALKPVMGLYVKSLEAGGFEITERGRYAVELMREDFEFEEPGDPA